jgi:hypothetical protein
VQVARWFGELFGSHWDTSVDCSADSQVTVAALAIAEKAIAAITIAAGRREGGTYRVEFIATPLLTCFDAKNSLRRPRKEH